MTIAKVCTVAGAAARSGAGIQADLKTFQELGVYGFTAITAINAKHPNKEKKFIHSTFRMQLKAQLLIINEQEDLDALKTGNAFLKRKLSNLFPIGWRQLTIQEYRG